MVPACTASSRTFERPGTGEQDDRDDTAVLSRTTGAGTACEGQMDLQLHDRTALITGAGSGIGRATARALAQEGMRVALLDRDSAALEGTAALVRDAVPEAAEAVLVLADVTDEEQVRAGVLRAVDGLGGVDHVVCCAGISGPVGSSIEDTDLAAWNTVLAVNVTGPFLVLKHALPALRIADRGSIVLLASDSALVASPGMVPYCASKAAVVQFGRALSVDLLGTGIRVNSIAPSIVDTPMSRGDLGEAALDDPGFPVQTADEVAAHVAYLLSPHAAAVNGTTLISDFGYTARSGFPA
ncbi:SDR family oxidoreductase [Microbacterium oxydans]|uniref:SDR family NAD(P)-dependent oxidoreductase n=2 Tax=Microbacteriaceae TaxID=85023 RepID=UPI000A637C33|nr:MULTISPECIES: SDR family oxidoreductase [Microbacterium]NYF28781.1 dihydroanticapsin dehydrogenase [Microbacterium sp. JAI119]GED39672.1 short-chain dehydrogenase [Microbacterium oxydans]